MKEALIGTTQEKFAMERIKLRLRHAEQFIDFMRDQYEFERQIRIQYGESMAAMLCSFYSRLDREKSLIVEITEDADGLCGKCQHQSKSCARKDSERIWMPNRLQLNTGDVLSSERLKDKAEMVLEELNGAA